MDSTKMPDNYKELLKTSIMNDNMNESIALLKLMPDNVHALTLNMYSFKFLIEYLNNINELDDYYYQSKEYLKYLEYSAKIHDINIQCSEAAVPHEDDYYILDDYCSIFDDYCCICICPSNLSNLQVKTTVALLNNSNYYRILVTGKCGYGTSPSMLTRNIEIFFNGVRNFNHLIMSNIILTNINFSNILIKPKTLTINNVYKLVKFIESIDKTCIDNVFVGNMYLEDVDYFIENFLSLITLKWFGLKLIDRKHYFINQELFFERLIGKLKCRKLMLSGLEINSYIIKLLYSLNLDTLHINSTLSPDTLECVINLLQESTITKAKFSCKLSENFNTIIKFLKENSTVTHLEIKFNDKKLIDLTTILKIIENNQIYQRIKIKSSKLTLNLNTLIKIIKTCKLKTLCLHATSYTNVDSDERNISKLVDVIENNYLLDNLDLDDFFDFNEDLKNRLKYYNYRNYYYRQKFKHCMTKSAKLI